MKHPTPSSRLEARVRALEEALAEYAGLYGLSARAREVMPAPRLEAILRGHGQTSLGALTDAG